ncbi:hypothetical protein E2562_031606 [Oryza meyeriana var. granulata]|uniref:Uncharacterized protein n=1 Tax=Oryza meyeriana var. granulata TaxID=110450 RepID=A0A6G1CJX3_9ORYZ|nr:hypothetical protein E2562_031606 [Oryza meyeriana var. granulata]
METLPERLQRRQQLHLPHQDREEEPHDREDDVAGPSDSKGLKPLNLVEREAAAPSYTSQGLESRMENENPATTPSAPQGVGVNVPELQEILISP